MPTVALRFNHPEDDGINLSGSVKFNSDFDVSGIEELTIRGLGEWRHVPENVIQLSGHAMENLHMKTRKARFANSKLIVMGIKARTDILLPFSLRQKGEEAVKATLTKFFKTLSNAAKVDIRSGEEVNENENDNS